MKKKSICGYSESPQIIKILLVMRISLFLMVISISPMIASTALSQNLKLIAKDATVREIFRTIEEQSHYTFFYNDQFNDLNKVVTVPEIETNIDGAMLNLLASTNLTYQILDDKLVVIAPREMQQGIVITGVVKEEGLGIPGASVTVRGTNIGTATDIDGKYTINSYFK